MGSILAKWGFNPVTSLASLKPPRVLVAGPDALKNDLKRGLRMLMGFVRGGGRVLVLEQNVAFPADLLPFPLANQYAEGSMAYPRGAHPALGGVKKRDISIWGRDQVVFLWPFTRSSFWPLIVDASSKYGMNLAPVIETSWGKGHIILSQLLIGRKLDSEPTAKYLLARFVEYLAETRTRGKRLASFLNPTSLGGTALKLLGFRTRTFSIQGHQSMELEMALNADADIVLLPGRKDALAALLNLREELEKFTGRGGWLIIQDLDAGAVALLSRLVREDLILRKLRQERIQLTARTDPLMAGLGNHELYWEKQMDKKAAEEARFLFGDRPLRDDVLTGAIVYDDVAALSRNQAISNHLTSEDHWKYIYYGGDTLKLNWRRPFPVYMVVARVNKHYKRIEELILMLDDDVEHKMRAKVPEDGGPITFRFPARPVRRITLKATRFVNVKPYGPFGWDTVEVYRSLSDSFRARVVPLTRPAGLVKFPMHEGGILLNMVSLADKRGERVLMQLLHNLGVPRTGPGGKRALMEDPLPGGALEGEDENDEDEIDF